MAPNQDYCSLETEGMGFIALIAFFIAVCIVLTCKRSGKSSIQRVVFHKMQPNETLFLESTTKISKDNIKYQLPCSVSLT